MLIKTIFDTADLRIRVCRIIFVGILSEHPH